MENKRKYKLLIVEDELAYMVLLTTKLEEIGYAVFTASTGEEGLIVASKQQPDLIILDIRMPVMDGILMLNKLRESEFGLNVEVIILTNLEPDGDILRHVIKGKPSYYLIKTDIQMSKLFSMIETILPRIR